MAGQQNDEFLELERQLAAIKPQASRVDRAELLFRAGQESVRARHRESAPGPWMWQLSTGLLAVVALGLAWRMHNSQPEMIPPRTVERIKYVQVWSPKSLAAESTHTEDGRQIARPAPATELSREHYVQQRRVAVSLGLDGLGDPWSGNHSVPSSLTSYRDLRANFWDDPAIDGGSPAERNRQL